MQDVAVSITPDEPVPNYCVELSGTNESVITLPKPDIDFSEDFTIEFWLKTASSTLNTPILQIPPHEFGISPSGHAAHSDGLNYLLQPDTLAEINDDQWHHIAIVNDFENTGALLYVDTVLVAIDSLFTFVGSSALEITTAQGFTGSLSQLRVWSTVRDSIQIESSMNVSLPGSEVGLAGYWTMNEGTGSVLFDTSTSHNFGELSNCTWAADGPEVMLGATTNSFGVYRIEQIPFANGAGTIFTVVPYKRNHFFLPEQLDVPLNSTQSAANNVDFTDNSLVPIYGRIIYQDDENECPVEGVRILKNGEGVIPPCFTDEDGYYVFEVENGESIRISAEYPDHTFNIEYYYAPPGVTMPLNNIDFVDETEVDIRVEVVGGDDHFPIGDFEVTLHSVNLCYFKEIENGDWADGGITLRNIPPLDYNVTVTADSENDPFALFGNYIFDTRLAELTTIDSLMDTLRFVWKAPLEIEVSWPETLELHQFADNYNWDESLYEFYVLTQNDWYEIEIQAFEDYSWGGQDQISYLNNCGLTIVDEVGTQGEIETNFQDTIYVHRFAPYIPNFLTGTGRQYQNLMSVTVHDVELNRYAEQLDFVLIEGVKPMEYTFTSTTPEIPTLILHDPPGDASYSSFLEHHSFTSVSTYSTSSGTVESDFHTAYLALDSTVGLGSGFFTSEYTLDGTDDLEWGMVETSSLLNSNTIMTTTTTTEGFSTSSDDQIIGDGSDLFFGGARNLIWGHIKMVSWDSDIQEIILKDSVMITEGDYKTEFIYTENQIKNTVIPDLIELEETESVLQWLAILDRNEYNKANADSIPGLSNLSFNAGASYSYEVETTAFQDTSWTFVTEFDDSFGIAIGAQFNGAGYVYNTKKSTITFSDSTFSEIIDTTKTYSFTLADNDETSDLNEYADYFSVNVKKDPIYLTPVFELVSGISSCPWEPNTQPREGVDLTANTYSANNLQEGESAAFILTLGNTSQSEEDRRYYLTVKHGTNPNGATIKINGVPLEDQMAFDVPADGTAQAVMTVEQGPLAYEYENLTLEFYSECDRGSEGIYDNPPEDQEPQIYHHFSMEKSFDVTWEPPYSRIAIGSPEDDWIVNQANDDNLNVLLRDYDLTKPDFKSIKLQYKIPSSDIWFPAFEIVRDTLEANYPVYANIPWDVSGIPDGIYEIRAATTDSIQADYYTGSLQGVIDRVSPELLSPPEPADDILEPGDVISISFAEEIDATTLDEADISLINYGGLDIGIEVTAFENTVFITPNISNFWFENDILIASVSGIKDLYGNEMEEAETWEFYVNSNPVNWNVTQIDVIKSLGEEMTLTANLINEGGQHYSYIFTDDADSQYHPDLQYHAPDWLTITPTSRQLIPLDTQEISFEISDQIGFGHYETTIYAHTSMGNEAIQIEVDVLSDPPNWTITEFNNFQSNMSVIGELDFEGDISVDTNDIIGAFMQEESGDWVCRGVANIESVPYIPSHPYQVFLTIYSDESDPVRTEDEIVFRVWDNSENKEYYQIDHSVFGGTLMYLANEVYGTPMTPINLATVTDMIQDIPLTAGWTWFSTNIDLDPNTINDVLGSLNPAEDDFIKNQDAYAQYFADEWVGTLGVIRNSSMYKINLAEAQILEIIGELKDPELYSISYNTGWKWISYIPHISMSVNQAMSERTNTTGDFIKNQCGYAFYVDAFTGWIGSLRFMNPGEGFMLYSSATGSFNYPGYQIRYDDDYPEYEPVVLRDAPDWSVNPQNYEYTASITAEIQINGNPAASGNYMLGAFADEDCRGSVTPINVGGTWMYFLTVFSNAQNEEIELRIYDEDADEILNPSNSFTFNNDLVMGSPSNPYSVNILGTLSTPQNVTIQIAAGEVQISWDIVTGANSYKVLASDDPYGTFIDISNSGTFDNNRWTAIVNEERRFYHVMASTEAYSRSLSTSKKQYYRKDVIKK